MDPYKEIINSKEYHFFTGLADFKYRAEYHRHYSKDSNNEYYLHQIYYDIEVFSISKLPSEDDFKKWEPNFQLTHISDNQIIVYLNESEFAINADVVYLNEAYKPIHVQIDGDLLHGDYKKVPIAFKIHKNETAFRCKAGIETGRIDQRADGLYKEYTTGEFEDDQLTCAKEWKRVSQSSPCIKDKPTGKIERKGNCWRFEYYTGESLLDPNICDTYWGLWECEIPPPPSPPIPPVQQKPKGPGCAEGCINSAFFIFLGIWFIFYIWLAIINQSFYPILLGIVLPFGLFGIGYLFEFIGRYLRPITQLFSWLFKLLLFFVIGSLILGLVSLFNSHNRTTFNFDKDWSDQSVVDVYRLDQTDTSTQNTNPINKKYKRIHLKWIDFDNQKYKGSFDISYNDILKSNHRLNMLQNSGQSSYHDVYSNVYKNDVNALNNLYLMLDSIRNKRGQDLVTFANTIVTMVQSIKYVLILDKDCSDPYILKNQMIRELLNAGIRCRGFAPFGIRTPVQFFETFEGDCDTRTLLLYTIFKHFKYDVAIINSDVYGHSMLGLTLPRANGAYLFYNGKKYYFWETTSFGNKLGQLDRSIGNLNFWKIELN